MNRKVILIMGILFLIFSSSGLAVAQEPFSPKSLTAKIFADGIAEIEYTLDVDPTYAFIDVSLFGSFEDPLVVNQLGEPLDFTSIEKGIRVYTLGAQLVQISYETADLTGSVGRVWTFSITSPIDVKVILPGGAEIVSFNVTPTDVELVGDRTTLLMPPGALEVLYIVNPLGSPEKPSEEPPEKPPAELPQTQFLIPIAVAVIVALVIAVLILKRGRGGKLQNVNSMIGMKQAFRRVLNIAPITVFLMKKVVK